jgi:hypothetical protein
MQELASINSIAHRDFRGRTRTPNPPLPPPPHKFYFIFKK